VTISVPLLSREQAERLPERSRAVVEYRKSGLSLNHIQGCPLDCAYCIRHTYGLGDQRQPRALMSDAEAAERLVSYRYFQPHITPLQLLNRMTDPFVPPVRPHTLAVLADLDGRGLRNHGPGLRAAGRPPCRPGPRGHLRLPRSLQHPQLPPVRRLRLRRLRRSHRLARWASCSPWCASLAPLKTRNTTSR
jgi:hypothetical protein